MKGVSLTVERGDVLCLIGPSGSGKSTFLRCINQLETPDSGFIQVEQVRGKECAVQAHHLHLEQRVETSARAVPAQRPVNDL
ncbi:ATP-binding cassette domain-containing protein, partial [Klebsiella pneumoniae]|uniref:ATP-binding cassette domain-containing protein n=1 Tax=Klebsiella pneumoniae TaxID=573 RepID=UPI0027318BA9